MHIARQPRSITANSQDSLDPERKVIDMAGTDIQLARKQIVSLLESQKAQITMALPKHLTADRLCRVAVTEMSKNPALFDCSQTSVLASIIMAAQLGLEIGVNGQAYLVPYKGTCTLIPGWQGYVDLVSRSGRASVWTGSVRDGDDFEYTLGSAPHLKHTPSDEDAGNYTHVYAVGWVKGAQWPVIEVWSRAKVERHLKQYNKVGDRHYALQNENNFEMYGRKVSLLQVIKYMPKSIEMQQTQSLDINASEGLQNLTLSNSGIIDAAFVDISPDAQQAIDGAHTRTDAVKAAVTARGKSKQQDAAAQVEQKASAQPETQAQPADPAQQSETPAGDGLW